MGVAVINVHEAKTHLSKLLDRVTLGEEIIIARNGKPVARLTRIPGERKPRVPGTAKGQIIIGPDFDDPLPPEILSEFYDKDI